MGEDDKQASVPSIPLEPATPSGDKVPSIPLTPAEKTKIDDITLFKYTVLQLGPQYKESDAEVLRNIITLVKNEAFSVGNRMFETTQAIEDFVSLVVQCSVIAYQNRGVEGQTRQGELGQENHFIDWHQYLQAEVIRHGKRYVI